jgi:hypothetical protein
MLSGDPPYIPFLHARNANIPLELMAERRAGLIQIKPYPKVPGTIRTREKFGVHHLLSPCCIPTTTREISIDA